MEYPDDNVAMLLSVAFENQTIEVVFVDCICIDNPLTVVVSWWTDRGDKHTLPKLAKHKTRLLDFETVLEDLAWRLGADRLQRTTNGNKNIELGEPLIRWMFVPVYGRASQPMIAEHIENSSGTLDPDGGRSIPCPFYRPATLLEASKMYPPSGTGESITTEIIFSPKKD